MHFLRSSPSPGDNTCAREQTFKGFGEQRGHDPGDREFSADNPEEPLTSLFPATVSQPWG